MQEAVPVGVGAMAAILAMPIEKVLQVCQEASDGAVCQAANLNSPDQVVISGDKSAVERAADLAKKNGAKRAVMLPVSAPFHCMLMQPAQDRLAEDLRELTFRNPTVPVMCNADAKLVTTAEERRDALIRQVTGSVRWAESMQAFIALGVSEFLELGPGKVLCGLLRQIDRSCNGNNVEDEESLQKTLNHFSPATARAE
jgi:[acyl-carrier-protein] S-malonyltransferase